MRTKNNSGTNGWKVGFFILLFINITFVALVYYFLQPSKEQVGLQNSTNQTVPSGETLSAEIVLSEQDLEEFLQLFLNEGGNEVTPTIHIDKDVFMAGEWNVLGMSLQYLLIAEPFAIESGDMQLKVKEIQLGSLSLPVEQSLKIMEGQFATALPIIVDAENELVDILLTDIQTEQLKGLRLLRIDKEIKEYVFETTISKQNLLQ